MYYYVFNHSGYCVGYCQHKLNEADLAVRGEMLVQSNIKYDIKSIKLENGIIVEQVPTLEQMLEAIKSKYLQAVDDYMDRTVQERGYDNIAKCVTYEGDIDETFNREGTLAKQWRSRVYRACYNILAEVEAGIRPIPTVEELLDELPKIDWGD